MAHTFGDAPELALAVPFKNMSFNKWTGTLPDQWANDAGTPTGTRTKHYPGFDATRAIEIADTGVIVSADNTLRQEIAYPENMADGQYLALAGCVLSDLDDGVHGSGKGVVKLYGIDSDRSDYVAYCYNFVAENETTWKIYTDNSGVHADVDRDLIGINFETRSYNSESAPACLFDCFAAYYGLSLTSRSYTFTHYPTLTGTRIRPFGFGKSDRLAGGNLRTVDPSGGSIKWRITFPFNNVPASFVEPLFEFFQWNKGRMGAGKTPLFLRHNLTDPTSAHTSGEDYLKRPPWIICNIVEEEWPFDSAGSWLGAGVYNGVLTFEEI